MEYTAIKFDVQESVGLLTLNRVMIEELEYLLSGLELNEDIRVPIMTEWIDDRALLKLEAFDSSGNCTC